MKIEISQYKPSILRNFRRSKSIKGKWYDDFTGITFTGHKVLGISLNRGVVLSNHPFDYQFQNLTMWVYILSWPICFDIRWGKEASNFNKKNK